ncbi:MAG: L-aspartate oxidase [Methylovirgula sp.]
MDNHDLDGRTVIVGGGIAGLMTALSLAPAPCVLLSKAPLGAETSSILAQGGIAASVGPDDDPALHIADTLAAGDGLCVGPVVERIIRAAPAAIEGLERFGVRFDRGPDGTLLLGLEAAHRRKRIVHAGGDSTGREITRALTQAVRASASITVIEGLAARRLVVEDGAITGLLVYGLGGSSLLRTSRIVLATGGVGGLFMHGTNPVGSFGQGLALAARAGAALADLEFVQFHPTALDAPGFRLALISEAVRGEGAILVDEEGTRFMADTPRAELAPRDVVARAVWRHMNEGHRIFLDTRRARNLDFAARFPAVTALCRTAGIDPVREPIPVRPAAHYHMGGIKVDIEGHTSIDGLWACGEAACTGLHGANRLASNSLLEAVVTGGLTAASVAASPAMRRPVGRIEWVGARTEAGPVRAILSRAAGVLRDGASLRHAAAELYPLAASSAATSDAALVGLMIVNAALRRQESRGAHYREDFPQHDAAPGWRREIHLSEAFEMARDRVPEAAA